MGIPTVHISALYELAESVGSNRIVKGARIEHVCGDPGLGPEKDHEYGLKIIMTALKALTSSVDGPTVFDPAEIREAAHAS